MTLNDIVANWPAIATGLTGLGGGGLFVKLLEHKRAKRAQTDQVALDMVTKLQARIDTVERNAAERTKAVEESAAAERRICDAKLEAMEHRMESAVAQLRASEAMVDSLILAIELAPEKAAEAVAKVRERRDARRAA
jgi:hypothetical protein